MRNYNLGFISDEVIYNHIKDTVLKYQRKIDLEKFNSNFIDPIKLTFDAKVYGKSFEEIVETECVRQIDKSNTNHIGYFHQNLFKYAGADWEVPPQGFDIVNKRKKIYVEMKNKHNTMNAASSRDTYMGMQAQLLKDGESKCYLVEVIAKRSQDITWEGTFKGHYYSDSRIRRISIDKFYEVVFDDSNAFFKLCQALPDILDDVVQETRTGNIDNTVYEELKQIHSDTLKSLYLLAFSTYEGFDILAE